jgi:hypothetical protein
MDLALSGIFAVGATCLFRYGQDVGAYLNRRQRRLFGQSILGALLPSDDTAAVSARISGIPLLMGCLWMLVRFAKDVGWLP